jgi:hypothetical protein
MEAVREGETSTDNCASLKLYAVGSWIPSVAEFADVKMPDVPTVSTAL